MNTIICVDVETGGLDPATCPAIEVACVLYSVTERCVLESYATLLHADTNGAEAINRIPVRALRIAREPLYAWTRINEMVDHAQSLGPSCWMAHRAEFDRGFIAAQAPNLSASLPWVCSKFDCEWPKSKVGASLVEVALAHDVPVHANHRALTDCMLLAKVLERVKDTLPSILERAMQPKALFMVADTSFDAARNELAKAAGFSFDRPTKRWTRRMSATDAAALPFETREVTP